METKTMATAILEEQKLEALLGTTSRPARKRRGWIYAVAVLGLLATGTAALRMRSGKPPAFTTAPVRRQTIVKTISATGTIQAVTTVQVGTQVSGTISELHADFNSQVHKGQVIARLEPSQAEAQVAAANARWLGAQPTHEAAQHKGPPADPANW